MNGFTKLLIGLFWIGCAIYGCTVTPDPSDASTGRVVITGMLLGLMFFIGAIKVGMGVEKLQKGE
jgi:hypothetical protein